MAEKSKGEILKETLSYNVKNSYEKMDEVEIEKAYGFCNEYKRFLDICKTER